MIRTLLLGLHMLGLLLLAQPALADPAVDAGRLGRGINALGYDPIWSDPTRARFQPRHFGRIRDGGFRHVRIPLFGLAHMDGDNRLDPRWLLTLDRMVAQATGAGLAVILDEHDFRACGDDPAACHDRLVAFWQQVAPHFAAAPATVMFELLNEPNRRLTPEMWNGWAAELLAVVRRSNPHRTVLIGPGEFNGLRALDRLALPEDDRDILVTVHYYDPFVFTHQGASWTWPSREGDLGHEWGTPTDRAAVAAAFDRIAAWGRAHGRPMHLGEFGAYDKAPIDSRAAWTAAVARAAEAHGMPWSYRQFDHDFLAFDMARDDWIAPIHDALVPPR